jgi:hypothetical protein
LSFFLDIIGKTKRKEIHMAYTSKYSGTEIDAGIAQAKTNKADITSLRSLITGN